MNGEMKERKKPMRAYIKQRAKAMFERAWDELGEPWRNEQDCYYMEVDIEDVLRAGLLVTSLQDQIKSVRREIAGFFDAHPKERAKFLKWSKENFTTTGKPKTKRPATKGEK